MLFSRSRRTGILSCVRNCACWRTRGGRIWAAEWWEGMGACSVRRWAGGCAMWWQECICGRGFLAPTCWELLRLASLPTSRLCSCRYDGQFFFFITNNNQIPNKSSQQTRRGQKIGDQKGRRGTVVTRYQRLLRMPRFILYFSIKQLPFLSGIRPESLGIQPRYGLYLGVFHSIWNLLILEESSLGILSCDRYLMAGIVSNRLFFPFCNTSFSGKQGLALFMDAFLLPTKTLLLSMVLNMDDGQGGRSKCNVLWPFRALRFSILLLSSPFGPTLCDFFFCTSLVVLILSGLGSAGSYLCHQVCGSRVRESSRCFQSSKQDISNSFSLARSSSSLMRWMACFLRTRRMLIDQIIVQPFLNQSIQPISYKINTQRRTNATLLDMIIMNVQRKEEEPSLWSVWVNGGRGLERFMIMMHISRSSSNPQGKHNHQFEYVLMNTLKQHPCQPSKMPYNTPSSSRICMHVPQPYNRHWILTEDQQCSVSHGPRSPSRMSLTVLPSLSSSNL